MNNLEMKRQENRHEEPKQNEQQTPRRNPRLVVGSLDFFELLMEQDEQ